MRKVTLYVTEKLEFNREIDVMVPNEISDTQLEEYLDEAEKHGRVDAIDGFISHLKKQGITNPDGYDSDYRSPDGMELECDDYDYKE